VLESPQATEQLIGKLLVCAMSGDETTRKYLETLEAHLDYPLDGAAAKFYEDALRILRRKVER